jgi:hypothetical protein
MNELDERWRCDVVLKRDVFSTIERGHFKTDVGDIDAVLRRIDGVPWWSRPLAGHLFGREARALAAAPPGIGPPLLWRGRVRLVRGFIGGVPLHLAKPHGDTDYFRSAKATLRALHRAGITHNDLAKEQNWLRTPDGRAALTDFQLAAIFRKRGKLFRILAYEDLRHLLKHKRRYLPAALTTSEHRVLANKSVITRIWMASGKKIYYATTRGLFNFIDREGGGRRLVQDAPLIATRLKQHPQVHDAAVVAYPDRRAGTGLYVFVEASDVSDNALMTFLKDGGAPMPERLQIAPTLPRRDGGELRTEILQLIAMNQIDLIEPLITNEAERDAVATIVAGRRNLRDRFSY